jgi:hypothetical protein
MGKPNCKMTLKDLLDYLNAMQEVPDTHEPSRSYGVDEQVIIRGRGTHTMVLSIEAMKQIVHSSKAEAVCAN